MSTEITNRVIERYEREGVVCTSKLRGELLTTAAADNIDHNPSSTSMVADSCHWIFSIYKRKQKEIQNEINKKF